VSCGAGLAPEVRCASCNSLNTLGNSFCAQCGSALAGASWAGQGPGAGGVVSDGVWERGPDEFVRRVDPEDARKLLGNRSVRVPPGSVGVVVVDGAVERVLPAGERTTLNLFERVGDFFLGRSGRSAFYLVDQRPIPIPFVVQARPAASGRAVSTQVLASFTLPRDKVALGTFLSNVLGTRESFGAADLHALLRPEVVRVAQETLERLALADDVAYGEAEARLRERLAAIIGPRFGLTIDVSLAPLTTIASLDFHLGRASAPRVRKCVACQHELPASLGFCDACGAKQPAVIDSIGAQGALSSATPLFTADGQQVELDLVVRVHGQHEDFAAESIAPALIAAAAQHLRRVGYAALASEAGLAALEAALQPGAKVALQAYGLTLVTLSALDLKTKTGQWLLSARADLERAKADVAVGHEWAEQRGSELDLEQLTVQLVLRQQATARAQKLSEREADVADREARVALDDRVAAVERSGVARGAELDRVKSEARRDGEVRSRDARIEDERLVHAAALEREAARRELDNTTKDRDEARQIEKLRAMAALEREGAAAEHAEVLERRRQIEGLAPDAMIAIQAAELAQAEGGGAAWAQALAARTAGEAERRHAGELREVFGQAMDAMAKVASSRAEAGVVGQSGPVVTVGRVVDRVVGRGVDRAGEAELVACTSCGKSLRAGSKFCGACGAAQ